MDPASELPATLNEAIATEPAHTRTTENIYQHVSRERQREATEQIGDVLLGR